MRDRSTQPAAGLGLLATQGWAICRDHVMAQVEADSSLPASPILLLFQVSAEPCRETVITSQSSMSWASGPQPSSDSVRGGRTQMKMSEYAQRDPAWSGRHVDKQLWCASSALDSPTDGGLPCLGSHQGPDMSHPLHIHQLISPTRTLWSSYDYKQSHFTDEETEANECALRSKSKV